MPSNQASFAATAEDMIFKVLRKIYGAGDDFAEYSEDRFTLFYRDTDLEPVLTDKLLLVVSKNATSLSIDQVNITIPVKTQQDNLSNI